MLFLFDDDTLMFPDCAEEDAVAAVGARSMPVSSLAAEALGHIARRPQPCRALKEAVSRASRRGTVLGRALNALSMSSVDQRFVGYDPPARRAGRGSPAPSIPDTLPATLIFGYAITVRRRVALLEPFDGALLGHSPGEDLDATYRFARHGANLYSTKGRIHHFQVAGGRVSAGLGGTALQMTNMAYFIQKNAERPASCRARHTLWVLRHCLARAFKDVAGKRLGFAPVRGTAAALPVSRRIFAQSKAGLADWYRDEQARLLALAPPRPPAAPTGASVQGD